uniref:Replication protein A 70 kDa DNA-binding subunit B/D first OB fold domain-containing protein n=1 Tax=Brassica oleracea var. oleracea TaxID=109376 RepID=A0A0D2ZQK8_BRAOL
MSSIMQVTSLKDVKPFKSGWKVHVKVLHTWKQYNAVHGDTLEIVLSDDNTYMESKGRLLPVGAWRWIQNFSLSPANGCYRSTDHSYKMSFVQNRTITRSPLVNEDMFLSLVDFQSVLSGSLNPNFLIDVIGQVMELGDLETIQVVGKPKRKVEFTLRDI